MQVCVVRDGQFKRTRAGEPGSVIVDYERFSKRYLDGFSEVILIGRVFEQIDDSVQPATGPGVSFVAIPGYRGPIGFLRKLPAILRCLWRETPRNRAYILRLPMVLPLIFAIILWVKRVPFAVEVIGDPNDAYSSETTKHPLAPFFQWLFVSLTKWACQRACAAAYVTAHSLQANYPPRSVEHSFAFTSLDLPQEAIRSIPRTASSFVTSAPTLINIGMMQQHYKGHDTMLQALKLCHQQGLPAQLELIGDGPLRAEFEQLATELGLANSVVFHGLLPSGKPVFEKLDHADLFIMASRQEGLPRGMIEACARGLPCLGTHIGGIPELIEPEFQFAPDDISALANKTIALMQDPQRLAEISRTNITTAERYEISHVRAVRRAFYQAVVTASQLQTRK